MTPPDEARGLRDLVNRACDRIAPAWPLDRFIAVNPFWKWIDTSLPHVSSRLTALSGARLLMPRAWFRDQWRSRRILPEHLAAAVAENDTRATVAQLVALLEIEEPPVEPRARVMDVVDRQRDLVHRLSWRDFVVHGSSQFCASYFDEAQAKIEHDRTGGLYASFRRHALHDQSPALLMGFRQHGAIARWLPATAVEMVSQGLAELRVPRDEREAYLTSLLLDINGWASWCAYLRWTARLAGGDDDHIAELLAVRLAWEWMLFRGSGAEIEAKWNAAVAGWSKIDEAARASQADDWLLQRAHEIAWQEELCSRLCRRAPVGAVADTPSATAVFCIDVRSEVFRRALEVEGPSIATSGFAGFFGIPLEYQPIGAAAVRPQLPGLLAPRLRVTDEGLNAGVAGRRAQRLAADASWRAFKTSALSSFALVESLGLAFAGKLFADAFDRSRSSRADDAGLRSGEVEARRPRLTSTVDGKPLGVEDRCTIAAGILRGMSLTRGHPRVVALVGHGSTTRNNPHRAGLDCGACCGQTGEVNARAAAALLNEPEVRAGLARRGIEISAATRFVSCLHDTTTDEVSFFDLDEVPPSHAGDLAELRRCFERAGERARRERARRLGLNELDDASLAAAMRARARDWAEVRPEWGLADNAAFVVAPRARTRGVALGGRAFLHDYRHEDDPDGAVLELIMTAPMVVTHWINMQYYASAVDNRRYGSGNKLLHNVVGGHLGVFEGNGGDLRIGLPMQSLHDGERWMHTPLRLSVLIEAPRAGIDAVLEKHETVRALVENEWLYLFQIDPKDGGLHARRREGWREGELGSATGGHASRALARAIGQHRRSVQDLGSDLVVA